MRRPGAGTKRYRDDVLIKSAGRHALLLELADLAEAQRWYAELQARRQAGELPAAELVPGARTVLVDGLDDPAAARARLGSWTPARDTEPPPAHTVEIPVHYDGPDLAEVAARWGMTADEAAGTHAGTAYTVAFCGFSPGFAYLAGLPDHLSVPRRETPRTRVPAGSVGLAGTWCGVYPQESPGGWALVGHTDLTLFDLDDDPPALLAPGTAVRFVCRDVAVS
jgi:KipI family sensor histidine kinase inhibitor